MTTPIGSNPSGPIDNNTYGSEDSYVFRGTLSDGTICSSQIGCGGVPSSVKLEKLNAGSREACGKYTCVMPGRTPLNGKFDTLPFSTATPNGQTTLSPVPKRCGDYLGTLADRLMHHKPTNHRFNAQSAYYWSTASFLRMEALQIPVESLGQNPWRPVAIKINYDDPDFCNAFMNFETNTAEFGNCQANFGIGNGITRMINTSADGSVVVHEIGGHARISYLNPNIGRSYGDNFGSGMHETSDLAYYFLTGSTVVGQEIAPFIARSGSNSCWLRRLDELKPLEQGSSLECHALSENLSPFFVHIAMALQSRGVPSEKARDFVEKLWTEQFLYYTVYPISPKDIVAATVETAKNLYEAGEFASTLGGKVTVSELLTAINVLADALGYNKYVTPNADPDPLAWMRMAPNASYGNVERAVALPGGRVAAVRDEVFRIKDGFLAGDTVRIEGGSETTVAYRNGRKKVFKSYNKWFAKLPRVGRENLGSSITLSRNEAAGLIGEKNILDEIKRLMQNGTIKWSPQMANRLFADFRQDLIQNRQAWAGRAELVVPIDRPGVHYKFTVGPFVIYVDASGKGSPFLGKSVFD